MAVAAFELDGRAIGTAPDQLHVDGVIQLDRAGITRRLACDGAQGSEFGMAVLQPADVSPVGQVAGARLQLAMTFGAGLIARCGNIDSAAMLAVARGALERFCCGGVVNGTVVAREAGAVGGFRGESPGLLQMARRAFSLQNRMC